MGIGFRGQVMDEPRVRAGFIGCGSHSFRNVYPALQFAPVELAAVCDLDADKARAFAGQFGAADAYDDYAEMVRRDDLDAGEHGLAAALPLGLGDVAHERVGRRWIGRAAAL